VETGGVRHSIRNPTPWAMIYAALVAAASGCAAGDSGARRDDFAVETLSLHLLADEGAANAVECAHPSEDGTVFVVSEPAVELTVVEATACFSEDAVPAACFVVDEASAARLQTFSRSAVGKSIAIVWWARVLAVSKVLQPIGAHFQITGDFTAADVKAILAPFSNVAG